MGAPLAVSTTNPYPGLHLAVRLVRGAQSASIGGLRVLIATPPETAQGDITVGTEVRPVFSKEDVKTATGRSLGYFAYQSLFANDQQAQCDLVACAESGGVAASATFTFGGTPTSTCVWEIDVSGYVVEVQWLVGETDDEAAANAAARLNSLADKVFAIASAALEVTTLTARSKGPAGNDIKISVKQTQGEGATLTASASALEGGTLEVDYTTALSSAQVKEYDYILLCMSNEDAQSASSSSNPARLATHIDLLVDGPEGKLQQGVLASTGTRDQAKVNTSARNHTNLEHVNFQNSRDLPCEVAAAEIGDRMRRRRRESNANRVRQPIRWLRGVKRRNQAANIPTDTQFRDAADNGLTLYSYDANGHPICLRAITTYHQDGSGNQDRRCFDVNEVDAIYDYVKDLRTGIPQEFQTPDEQVKIMRDREEGDDPLPENTVEERDVRAFIVGRTRGFWVPKGTIQGPAFEEAVEKGTLIVEVNDSDETQCDIFIPAKAVKILAKFGLFVAKES